MRKLLFILILLGVAVGIGLWWVQTRMGERIVAELEKVASAQTGTAVSIDRVDIQLLATRASVRGIIIANPRGYTDLNAAVIPAVHVNLDPFGSNREKVTISTVTVASPAIVYETGITTSNLREISDAVGSGGGGGGPKIVIRDLWVRNMTATVRAPVLGVTASDIEVDDIHLEDIGEGGGGLSDDEVTQLVMNAILRAIGEASVEISPKLVGRILSEAGGSAGGLLGGAAEAAGESGSDVVEGAKKAIEDLFGN